MTVFENPSANFVAAQERSTCISPSAADNRTFRMFCLNRDYQGFLATGPHSGTHWIKWMLSHAIAHHYNVPPPKYFNNASSNDLIGHPRHPRIHPTLPRLASTHSTPPYPMQWRWLRRSVSFPAYAVVVRDIRKVLVSHYEKWNHRYKIPFSEFVKGDPQKRGYIIDIWQYVRFMNRWGDVANKLPQETLVLKYEDFRADRVASLARLAKHFKLDLTDADLAAGAAVGDKKIMELHRDPSVEEDAIRPDGHGLTQITAADNAVIDGILDKHLRHDFGYSYFSQPRGFRPKAA